MMSILATLFLFGYTIMFIVVGLGGIFFAEWELQTLYGFTPEYLASPESISFLSQFGFLKAIEAAFGFFCLIYRRDILDGNIANVIFLLGCGLGIFARGWAWYSYGQPAEAHLYYVSLEAVTFFVVWIYSRRARGE